VRLRQSRLPGKTCVGNRHHRHGKHAAPRDNLTSREVYELAVDGNELAHRIFVSVGEALGVALAMLVNTFNFRSTW